MFIKLQTLKQKYGLAIRGVIHVGAHYGEEYNDYKDCGVAKIVFVEPASDTFKKLYGKFHTYPDVKLMQWAFGEEATVRRMHIETVNEGQSSSLLKPKLHLQQFPDITFDSTEIVQIRPMDQFAWLRSGDYNFLNMDVQGYELNVLKGSGKTLEKIDYIYTEVNRDEVYEGCARIEQLDDYLHNYNFQRVETCWCNGGNEGTWGDAFYIKRPAKIP
jgi:FkbM family methyltransferase